MVLQVEQLTGGYGQRPVLKDVSFTVPDHQMTLLIGLNGSGKSTTINHVIGLLAPQKGMITLNGAALAIDPMSYKAQIAYIPEQPVLYEELTLTEHIEAALDLHGIDRQARWPEVERLLKLFRLENKGNWYPVHFSKGMRQKVMIVMAFAIQAPFYVIDEPFLGLDVKAVRDLLMLIDERKAAGASFLLTTHVVDVIKAHADNFVYLADGQVVQTGTMADLDQLPDLMESEA